MNGDFSVSNELFAEMQGLVTAILAGDATSAQKDRLEELIRQDIVVCDLYLKLVFESSALLDWARCDEASGSTDAADTPSPASPVFPPLPLDAAQPLVLVSPAPAAFPSFVFSYLLAAIVLGTAMLLGWAWKVSDYAQVAQRDPQEAGFPKGALPPEGVQWVGRVTRAYDCKWSELKTAAFEGAGVPLGRKYALASGLLEIAYDSGVKVILEGPCNYEVASKSGGFLALGKVTAKVEKEESKKRRSDESEFRVPNAELFSVRTPTAIVTDLGTVFGVEYDKSGVTRSSVFRGSVRLQAVSANGTVQGSGHLLREHESARVEKAAIGNGGKAAIVAEPWSKRPAFVRKMPNPADNVFDLVDVVAGGNGSSGRRDGAVNPLDGSVVRNISAIDYYRAHPKEGKVSGDGRYHRVSNEPFIDGVFIPNGKQGPVQVDSAGHRFDGFPPTSNVSSGWIHSGGKIPRLAHWSIEGIIPCVLGGVDYSSRGHGLLFIHSNKGITFDLDAIRAAQGNRRIAAFRSVAGICPTGGIADIWVLVDGRARFARREATPILGAMPITIPLRDTDRFLTLAATEGGDNIAGDFVIFGDPRLELISDSSEERGKQKKNIVQ